MYSKFIPQLLNKCSSSSLLNDQLVCLVHVPDNRLKRTKIKSSGQTSGNPNSHLSFNDIEIFHGQLHLGLYGLFVRQRFVFLKRLPGPPEEEFSGK